MVFGSNGRLLPQKKGWRASQGFDLVQLFELYSLIRERKSYVLIIHLAVIGATQLIYLTDLYFKCPYITLLGPLLRKNLGF